MKSTGKLDANYSEFNVDNGDLVCDDFIETSKTLIYDGSDLSFQNNFHVSPTDEKTYSDCLFADLKLKNWADDAILQIIYGESFLMSKF